MYDTNSVSQCGNTVGILPSLSRMVQLASWKRMKKESGRRRERSGRRQEEVRRHGPGEDETDVELNEFRCKRLKCSFIQQFVDAVADLPQRQSVLLSVPVQLGQIVAVGKMVENVIDACVRARGQVLLD